MKLNKISVLFIRALLFVLLLAANSLASSASISVSGNEGLVTVSASASFSSYTTCDESDPPNCTTCDRGHFWVTYLNSTYCHETANGSASCSFTINAGVMSQGDHVFKVLVNDCNGGVVEEFATLTIDNTPSLTVTGLNQSGGWINPTGSVDFKDNPSGNDGSVYVILDNDPKALKHYEDIADWSWEDIAGRPIAAASLSNGEHIIEIKAQAANQAIATKEFIVDIDNTPEVNINDIGEINGSFDVEGTVVFTEHPISTDGIVALYFDGVSQGSAGVEESGWSYSQITKRLIDPTVLTNGPHTIKAIATASNGSKAEAQTTFNVDNTPKVTIDPIGELEGFLDIKGSIHFQEATSVTDGIVALYLDGVAQGSAGVEESVWRYSQIAGHEINASMLSNGEHTVEVIATAHNGAQDSAQITFNIDNTPEISLNGPVQAEGQFDVTAEVTFKENPDGFEGLITYYINDDYLYNGYQDGINVGTKFSDYYGALFDASKLTQGDHTFKVVATAINGAIETSSVTVNIAALDASQNIGAANGTCEIAPSTVNPINFATGNKYKRQVDIELAGPGLPLAFIRHYNSQLEVDGALGYGWTGSYSQRLSLSADTIILRQPDGRHVHFIDDGSGRYITATGEIRTFTSQSDGYTLTEAGGTQKTFDLTGLLTRIRDPNGNTQSITYNDGKISSASDNFGKTLGFAYDSNGRLSALTTPVGVFTYRYDSAGNLDRVDHPDGTYRTYIYDDPNDAHNLTGITNENGIRSLTVTYDDQDRAVTSELAGGAKRVKVDYRNNYQRTVTDSLENSTDFQLFVAKGIARIKSSSGAGCSSCLASLEDSYELSERLLIDSETDAEKNQTDYTYDERGNLLTKTEAAGTPQERTTVYTWHPVFNKPTTITRPSIANPGQVTTTSFEYDTAGNLLTVSTAGYDGATALSRGISYTYNANGQVLIIDGPRTDVSDVTAFTYYPNEADQGLSRGQLQKITNSLGQQTLYADYNVWGRPETVTDINEISTTFIFNAVGRVKSFQRNGHTTVYDYDLIGNLLSVTLGSGQVISYNYTAAGFLETITDNVGNYIRYAYDSEGNRVREEIHDAAGELKKYTDFGYDEYNRLANVFYPGGDFEDYLWDKNGNPIEFVDAGGKSIARGYDSLNRLEIVTQPGDVKTLYDYDDHDNLTQVTDAKGHRTIFTFNDLGDRMAQDSPDSGLTSYTYDKAGNLTSKTNANEITVTYAYDDLNRLVQINYPDAADNVTFGYDEQDNGKGRLTSMSDPSGDYAYTYDADGNLSAEERIIDGRIYTTAYQYDPTGILIGITYPNGRQVDYQLDPIGRVKKVTTTFGGVTSVVADNLTYLPFGPLTGYDAGGTIRIDQAYDSRFRLTGINAGTLMNRDYAFDPVGNVTRITDGLDPTRSLSFGYDDHYRLTSATGVYGTINYTYDEVGRTPKALPMTMPAT
jgi:YD repeat-containing protein